MNRSSEEVFFHTDLKKQRIYCLWIIGIGLVGSAIFVPDFFGEGRRVRFSVAAGVSIGAIFLGVLGMVCRTTVYVGRYSAGKRYFLFGKQFSSIEAEFETVATIRVVDGEDVHLIKVDGSPLVLDNIGSPEAAECAALIRERAGLSGAV